MGARTRRVAHRAMRMKWRRMERWEIIRLEGEVEEPT